MSNETTQASPEPAKSTQTAVDNQTVVDDFGDSEQGSRTNDPANKLLRTRKSDHDGRRGKKPKLEIPDKWVGGANNSKKTAKDNEILTTNRRMLTDDGKPMYPEEERRPKRKVAAMIGYSGKGYHGMQLNPPNKTIEGDLFKALVEAGAISKNNSNDLKKSGFMRAARTDKGVHAAGNVVSLKMIIEDEDLLKKINEALPDQIRMWGFQRVNKAFDCRKMCSSRIYEYLMPTYSLLPPRYKSPLYKLVKQQQKDHPEIRVNEKGEQFWVDLAQQYEDEGITQSMLDQLAEANREDIPLTVPLQIASDKVKKLSHAARTNWRLQPETLAIFRETLKQYLGAHNFHNFTNGKDYKDPSSTRYMKTIDVSDPFIIGNTEWISIKIHGQSFMLHQIRKMIGMASLIVRTGCAPDKIKEAFLPGKVNIPKAPALGLLLEHPVYDGYNERLVKFGHEPLTFDKYADEMEAFKKKWIYSRIYEEEEAEHTFHGFFGFIDFFTGSESSNNGRQVFEFLTGLTHEQLAELEKKAGIVEAEGATGEEETAAKEEAAKEEEATKEEVVLESAKN